MTKLILTESQKSKLQVLADNVGDIKIPHREFTDIILELSKEGIDIVEVLSESYGVVFD